MKATLVTKFAVRSLARSKRRTLLSVIGIAVGCAVALFLIAFMRSGSEFRTRVISDSGMGHVRIAPSGWLKSRDNQMRLRDWRRDMKMASMMKEIEVVAPHARTTALLAFGTKVVGVEMVGVDPEAEQKFNRIARSISEGRYLQSGDLGVTVIGSEAAKRLDVDVDDDLLLTVVNKDGELEYAMLRIVGLVHTGSKELDAAFCHVTLEEIEELTGLAGAGELTLKLRDYGKIGHVVSQLRGKVSDPDDVVTWKQVVPAMGADADSDRAFNSFFLGIVIFVVILGITSAQITALLERKRELAVLIALGMKSRQTIRLVLFEALVLGILGAGLGLVLGFPAVYYTATVGINFEALAGGEKFTMAGVLFDPVFYSDLGPWMVPYALAIALFSTAVAAIYPAWLAVRINPTSALSLREA